MGLLQIWWEVILESMNTNNQENLVKTRGRVGGTKYGHKNS